jgi:hypothetical protein
MIAGGVWKESDRMITPNACAVNKIGATDGVAGRLKILKKPVTAMATGPGGSVVETETAPYLSGALVGGYSARVVAHSGQPEHREPGVHLRPELRAELRATEGRDSPRRCRVRPIGEGLSLRRSHPPGDEAGGVQAGLGFALVSATSESALDGRGELPARQEENFQKCKELVGLGCD